MRRILLVLAVSACGSPAQTVDAATDASDPIDASADKTAGCASTFGAELTDDFGRVDGTVLAVLPPDSQQCAQPNRTHLILQVTMHGSAYRMVINVDSVLMHELDAPLAGPAWSDGWHRGAALDYVSTLHVQATAFVSQPTATSVARISDALEIGAKVSVFATSSGGALAASAHLVHRNKANEDGAIVIGPDTASPHYLLVRFSNQAF